MGIFERGARQAGRSAARAEGVACNYLLTLAALACRIVIYSAL
jgi:hypothetical protein